MTRRRTTPVDDVPPDTLTIEEAARVVRIGKTTAYKLANLYVDSGGAEGLPAKRIGGQLRVLRVPLEEYLGGPIRWPIADASGDDASTDHGEPEPSTLAEPIALATRRRATRPNGSQLALGLDG